MNADPDGGALTVSGPPRRTVPALVACNAAGSVPGPGSSTPAYERTVLSIVTRPASSTDSVASSTGGEVPGHWLPGASAVSAGRSSHRVKSELPGPVCWTSALTR